jgi:hypothetical protein
MQPVADALTGNKRRSALPHLLARKLRTFSSSREPVLEILEIDGLAEEVQDEREAAQPRIPRV